MNSRELGSISSLWHRLLTRINKTSLSLQRIDIDLNTVISLYNSLIEFVEFVRNSDEVFMEIEADGELFSGNKNYEQDVGRTKRRKLQHGEMDTEVLLNGSQKFKFQTFYVVLDVLNVEMKKRRDAYQTVFQNFNFLFDLQQTANDQIIINVKNLVTIYPTDLDNTFIDECVQFKEFLIDCDFSKSDPAKTKSQELLILIVSNKLSSTFPNMETILRIFGCMAASNLQLYRRKIIFGS